MNQGQHGVFLQHLCKRDFQNKKCPLEERVQKGNDINPFCFVLYLTEYVLQFTLFLFSAAMVTSNCPRNNKENAFHECFSFLPLKLELS